MDGWNLRVRVGQLAQCASDYCGMPVVALVREVQDELCPTGSCKHC